MSAMNHPVSSHGHEEHNMSELVGGFVPLIAVFVYIAVGALFHLMIVMQSM